MYYQQAIEEGCKRQLAMISRGDHEEIMNYFRKHSLFDEVHTAFIERGNHEEIVTHITKLLDKHKDILAYIKESCSWG